MPQFLQRGFAADKRRREIWYYPKGEDPALERTKDVGASDYFYSEPSADGSPTLDDQITDTESPLALKLRNVRDQLIGSEIDAKQATDIVIHLAPRTAHLRATFEKGMRQLAQGASEIFTKEERVEAMLGLDRGEPTEMFREQIDHLMAEHPIVRALGLPQQVFERVMFVYAKENLGPLLKGQMPAIKDMFGMWIVRADEAVRDSHNSALSRMGQESNAREGFLQGLVWRLEAAPSEGAILPDCVVLALNQQGEIVPFMHADLKDTQSVVMPVGTDKLLIGSSTAGVTLDTARFNEAAAQSSYHFYLAHSNSAEFTRLHDLIGKSASLVIDEAVENAFGQFLPERSEGKDYEPDVSEHGGAQSESQECWQFTLTFFSCEDQETTDRIRDATEVLVRKLAKIMPLQRLDGITFAVDYATALREMDRGFANAPILETVDPEIGVGVAHMVTVMRDGVAKGHIVLSPVVAAHLASDDPADVEWAIHLIVNRLALVAMIEIVERALPGTQLRPIEDELQAWLHRNVHPALNGYVASAMSAGFGEAEELTSVSRQLLIEALERMRQRIPEARLAYRYDGDLDKLLGKAIQLIETVLHCAANHAGHCAALDRSPFDEKGALDAELDAASLQHWFTMYQADLAKFYERLGRWDSFDEFLFFNQHVERLMWQFGMFPWSSEDEGLRVEIPLLSDAEALSVTQH